MIPEQFEEAKGRIVVGLRRAEEPDGHLVRGFVDPESALVSRPFGPWHHAVAMLDLPEMRVALEQRHVRGWGIAPETVWRDAEANLRAVGGEGIGRHEDFWRVDPEDRNATARLWIPGWLAGFRAALGTAPVAATPTPRILLIGRSDQAWRLALLAGQAYSRAQDGLTPSLWTVDDGGRVVPLRPSTAAFVAERYARQAQALEAAGLGPCLTAEACEDGTLRASWPIDIRSPLVPDVDRLILQGPEETIDIPMNAVRSAARGMLNVTRFHPTRFRGRWPGETGWTRLREAAKRRP